MSKMCAVLAAAFAGSAAMAQLVSIPAGSVSGPVEDFENDGFITESQFNTPRNFFNGLQAHSASLDDNAASGGPGTWSWGDNEGGWGLLDSGVAHQTSGRWGIGVDTINDGFVELWLPGVSTEFGGYFAAPTEAGSVYGEPAIITMEARLSGGFVGLITFDYSETATGNGALHWMGFESDEVFNQVIVRGSVFVMDDVTWQLVPTPGTAALMALGGVAAIRRRR